MRLTLVLPLLTCVCVALLQPAAAAEVTANATGLKEKLQAAIAQQEQRYFLHDQQRFPVLRGNASPQYLSYLSLPSLRQQSIQRPSQLLCNLTMQRHFSVLACSVGRGAFWLYEALVP